ncbi:hypothetical protein FRX31_012184, partial [Thalictrum thalictroides]
HIDASNWTAAPQQTNATAVRTGGAEVNSRQQQAKHAGWHEPLNPIDYREPEAPPSQGRVDSDRLVASFSSG